MKRMIKPISAVLIIMIFMMSSWRIPAYSQEPTPNMEQNDIPEPTGTEWVDHHLLSSAQQLNRQKIPVEAKGIYITGRTAAHPRFQKLFNLVNTTELNAMVIDVKEDEGRLTYRSTVPLVKQIKADQTRFIPDIDQILQTLHENHVYTIARIVCFKDPLLAQQKPEWAMQKKGGGVWRDQKGIAWIDPHRKEVWEHNLSIAKEAAKKGFREIQFDYVRFPDNGNRVNQEVAFDQQKEKSKQQAIADFLAYAKKELEPYPVYVSADVFGLVSSVSDDMGIGQKWELISPQVDYISPMMYPSHYANGTYGLRVPDAQPYETIFRSLHDAKKKDQSLRDNTLQPAAIRPWYQGFTAKWVKGHITYGPREVAAQIEAGKDQGITQYLIWNASNTYDEETWAKGTGPR